MKEKKENLNTNFKKGGKMIKPKNPNDLRSYRFDLFSEENEIEVSKNESNHSADIPTESESDFIQMEIPIQDLESNPFNQRQDLEVSEDCDLYKSIKKYGLLNPLLVVKHYNIKPNKYLIIGGNRRFAVLKLIYGENSSKKVPCNVSLNSLGIKFMAKNLLFQLQDNQLRKDFSLRELYNILTDLKSKILGEFGGEISNRELARITMISEDQVSRIFSFDKLSDEEKNYTDTLSESASIEFSRATEEKRDAIMALNAKSVKDIRMVKNFDNVRKIEKDKFKKYSIKHNFFRIKLTIYKPELKIPDCVNQMIKEYEREHHGLWKEILD